MQSVILRSQYWTDRELFWRKRAFVELTSILLNLSDMWNRYIQKYMTWNDILTLVMLDLTDLLMWNDLKAISGDFFRQKNEVSVMMNIMLWNWFYVFYWQGQVYSDSNRVLLVLYVIILYLNKNYTMMWLCVVSVILNELLHTNALSFPRVPLAAKVGSWIAV